MLICGQFIAKDFNLWSTFLFVRFEKLNLSDFWGPQKRPNFWILDLCFSLEKLGFGLTFLKTLSCIYGLPPKSKVGIQKYSMMTLFEKLSQKFFNCDKRESNLLFFLRSIPCNPKQHLNSLGFVILYTFKWDNQSSERIYFVLQNLPSNRALKNPI